MKNNYGKTGCILALLLTTFCGITLSGCGDEHVELPTLVEDPEQYRGDEIEVQGVIVSVESEEEDESLLILLRDSDAVLICEFLKNEHQDSLEEGNVVTISGKVDILAGITLLRECRLVE